MGPGYNRMNRVTVQQTTQGLIKYLQGASPKKLRDGGIVIGGRKNTDVHLQGAGRAGGRGRKRDEDRQVGVRENQRGKGEGFEGGTWREEQREPGP